MNLDELQTLAIEFTKQWLCTHKSWNYDYWNSDLANTTMFPGNGEYTTLFKKTIWKNAVATFVGDSDDQLSKRALVTLSALKVSFLTALLLNITM